MATATDIVWLALMVAMMCIVAAFTVRHTLRIRDGRADPVIPPDWTSLERPASPPSSMRWGLEPVAEIEDDHVGRPFPSTAKPHPIGDLSRERRRGERRHI